MTTLTAPAAALTPWHIAEVRQCPETGRTYLVLVGMSDKYPTLEPGQVLLRRVVPGALS